MHLSLRDGRLILLSFSKLSDRAPGARMDNNARPLSLMFDPFQYSVRIGSLARPPHPIAR
jgi:hypothetical protein